MDLHDAAKEGNCEHLERLIGIGCSVDELDDKRMTALAYASQSTKATTGVLRLLIDSGADPNLPVSEDRKYAVGLAASSGCIAKVQLLLDAGADIRYLSKGSYSILVHCIYGLYDSEDLSNMLQFLHANGADLDAESDYGESPLSVASRFGRFDAVKCLLDRIVAEGIQPPVSSQPISSDTSMMNPSRQRHPVVFICFVSLRGVTEDCFWLQLQWSQPCLLVSWQLGTLRKLHSS